MICDEWKAYGTSIGILRIPALAKVCCNSATCAAETCSIQALECLYNGRRYRGSICGSTLESLY